MTGVIIATVIGVIITYLICGIPFGMIFAAKLSGIDVRKAGSGNIGMTNVARTAGGKAAALTFACDVAKGALCVLLGKFLISQIFLGGDWSAVARNAEYGWVGSWLFCAAVLGHIFSPYLHFKGGKGIAVGLGASLGMWWPMGLGLFAIFLLFAIPTGYVSLGSVITTCSLPIQGVFWGMSLPALIPVVIVAIVVVWSHRENIKRLMHGEERRFSIGNSKKGDGK
ncbi:MAG: glycerol-3-phosphate 1-O-acyltransferase PlsY [Atopobiaceae bacterium]|nr:glycerol-3-phosphate 1-O-acyltransferase PlsY [Atopobiaceae bacterium]